MSRKTLFAKLFNKKEIKFYPNKDFYVDILSDDRIKISTNTDNKILKAYYKTPQLASIVNYSAKVFSRNDLRFYNENGEEQENEFLDILENPHPLYSEGEFWETFSKQFDLFNIVLIYKVKGVGMPLSGMFILPFHLITIVPKKNLKPIDIFLAKDLNEIIDYYKLSYDNVDYKIPVEDVFMITGSSLRFDSEGFLVPDSIVKTLEYPILNIQANYEARYSLVQNRGALGLWVNQTEGEAGVIPIDEGEKKTIRDTFRRHFGLTKGRDIVGLTDANIRFENASIALKDLELSKAIQDDKIALCDGFNFPILLLNELEGSTFSNLGIAERLLYTNKTIPFWELVAKSLTREFIETGYLEFYTGDIEALKKDDKVEAETNQQNTQTVISLNEAVNEGKMSPENAVNTLVLIADVSEEIAKEVITTNQKDNETI
jgi:hypothetical protein